MCPGLFKGITLFGRGAFVGALDLATPASSGVVGFESCASQKCYTTTQIALTCSGVPHTINVGFKWAGSIITRLRPFFCS